MKTAVKGIRTNLKVFRIKQQLSQTDIAAKIGCSRATYSAIENGARNGRTYFWNELQRAFDLQGAEVWELMQIDER